MLLQQDLEVYVHETYDVVGLVLIACICHGFKVSCHLSLHIRMSSSFILLYKSIFSLSVYFLHFSVLSNRNPHRLWCSYSLFLYQGIYQTEQATLFGPPL